MLKYSRWKWRSIHYIQFYMNVKEQLGPGHASPDVPDSFFPFFRPVAGTSPEAGHASKGVPPLQGDL